jgi:hypothetical protein
VPIILNVTERHLELLTLYTLAGLFVVQTPIDLASNRLYRTPTLLATLVVFCVYVFAFVLEFESGSKRLAIIVSVVVSAIGWYVNRRSPNSLGWGDVLLVVPLVASVSFVNLALTGPWLLLASSSAAVHGVMRTLRKGKPTLPFGPHLIGTACFVMAGELWSWFE